MMIKKVHTVLLLYTVQLRGSGGYHAAVVACFMFHIVVEIDATAVPSLVSLVVCIRHHIAVTDDARLRHIA